MARLFCCGHYWENEWTWLIDYDISWYILKFLGETENWLVQWSLLLSKSTVNHVVLPQKINSVSCTCPLQLIGGGWVLWASKIGIILHDPGEIQGIYLQCLWLDLLRTSLPWSTDAIFLQQRPQNHYPLVNVYIRYGKSPFSSIFNGKTHYKWTIFNSYVSLPEGIKKESLQVTRILNSWFVYVYVWRCFQVPVSLNVYAALGPIPASYKWGQLQKIEMAKCCLPIVSLKKKMFFVIVVIVPLMSSLKNDC